MTGLAVIVPVYNEERLLPGLLDALAAQSDPGFTTIVVDNASTDATRAVLTASGLPHLRVITELTPGAGTAADTGFRYAIRCGATKLLRTDADCLPRPDWVATGRRLLDHHDLVCGRSLPRRDEHPPWTHRHLYPWATRTAARLARRSHASPTARAPFVLIHGHNLAITADLYERCGGTPREELRDGAEDVTLLDRAREHSSRIVRDDTLVVETSLRRLTAWGPWRLLRWHWNRRYVPTTGNEHIR